MGIAELALAGAGVMVAAGALYVAYRTWKETVLRTVDARLFITEHDHIVESYVTIRNGGKTQAVVDKIKVTRPKGAKVAWQIEKELGERPKSLSDSSATNVHDTRIIADPQKSVGCGMMIKLPSSYTENNEIAFKCRVSAADQWWKYRWISGRVMMTSATPTVARMRSGRYS